MGRLSEKQTHSNAIRKTRPKKCERSSNEMTRKTIHLRTASSRSRPRGAMDSAPDF